MRSLYADPNTRDLAFDSTGNLKMVSGEDEAAQHLRLLLSTRMGEWFLDIRHGLDHGSVLGQKFPDSESHIGAAVYDAVKHDSRNIRIQSLSLEYDHRTRKLTIRLTAIVDDILTSTEVKL